MLSNENIAYLSGLCNDLEKIDKIKKQNFTEKKFNHMVLYHDEKKISSLIYVKVILECSG